MWHMADLPFKTAAPFVAAAAAFAAESRFTPLEMLCNPFAVPLCPVGGIPGRGYGVCRNCDKGAVGGAPPCMRRDLGKNCAVFIFISCDCFSARREFTMLSCCCNVSSCCRNVWLSWFWRCWCCCWRKCSYTSVGERRSSGRLNTLERMSCSSAQRIIYMLQV